MSTQKRKKAAKKKQPVVKYDIVCGEGQHRSYTACIAELIMLSKYGNQDDYFWRQPNKRDEFVRLIKLGGRIAKQFDRDKLAFFIYKNPDYKFDSDVGLIIYNLKNFKYTDDNFDLEELVRLFRFKNRPESVVQIVVPEKVTENKSNKTTLDFLGDI